MSARRGMLRGPAFSLLLLAGCTVGPDFKAPTFESTPPGWQPQSGAGMDRQAESKVVAEPFADSARWWTIFDDPILSDLVSQAMAQNLDVQTAALRIEQARAQRDIAAADGLPQLTVDTSYTREKISRKGVASSLGGSAGGSGGGSGMGGVGKGGAASSGIAVPGMSLLQPFNIFQWAFDATWEVDLFGRVRRNVEASEADLEADREARNDAMVSLAANVARAYFDLRGAQRELAITTDNLKSQQDILALTQSRARSGLAPQLDVANAGATLAQTQGQLPTLRARLAQDANQIDLLLGKPPGESGALLDRARPLPPIPPVAPIGLPADLLRRRPDIRESEAQLHAATARVGVAIAQLFPTLTLTGSYGLQGLRFNDLKDWGAHFYSFGPQISVPIFEGGKLEGQIRLSKAETEEALLAYRKAVLSAFNDADNAIVAYGEEQVRTVAFSQAAGFNRDALALAKSRYVNGLSDFRDVLQAEQALFQTESAEAESMATAATDLVALYKALGGGWDDEGTEKGAKE